MLLAIVFFTATEGILKRAQHWAWWHMLVVSALGGGSRGISSSELPQFKLAWDLRDSVSKNTLV